MRCDRAMNCSCSLGTRVVYEETTQSKKYKLSNGQCMAIAKLHLGQTKEVVYILTANRRLLSVVKHCINPPIQ